MLDAERLMTVRQVAGYLSVSENTVHQLVARNELSSIKIGRTRRFLPRDVHAFLEERKAA